MVGSCHGGSCPVGSRPVGSCPDAYYYTTIVI